MSKTIWLKSNLRPQVLILEGSELAQTSRSGQHVSAVLLRYRATHKGISRNGSTLRFYLPLFPLAKDPSTLSKPSLVVCLRANGHGREERITLKVLTGEPLSRTAQGSHGPTWEHMNHTISVFAF